MRLRILAVGARQPEWVDAATQGYLRRIRTPWRLELVALELAPRGARGAADAVRREGERVLAALRDRERVVLLDESGKSLTTRELAGRFAALAGEAPDVALLIGGPDAEVWSLSKLTLPHGLARVLLVEQVYRAQSLLLGHPYHRD